jgi:hypothetical protein
MTAPSTTGERVTARRRVPVLAVAVAVIIALAASTIVAVAALAAGADPGFAPLHVAIYGPFVVVGVLAGYLGWRLVNRHSARPAATLRVLVPVLTVLSFLPDAVLLATGFIPGTSVTGVIALALMHLIVVGVVVPLCLRVEPVGAARIS